MNAKPVNNRSSKKSLWTVPLFIQGTNLSKPVEYKKMLELQKKNHSPNNSEIILHKCINLLSDITHLFITKSDFAANMNQMKYCLKNEIRVLVTLFFWFLKFFLGGGWGVWFLVGFFFWLFLTENKHVYAQSHEQ